MTANNRRTAMKKTLRTTLLSLSAFLIIGSGTAYADHDNRNLDASDLLIGIATSYLASDTARDFAEDRTVSSRRDRGYSHQGRTDPAHDEADLAHAACAPAA